MFQQRIIQSPHPCSFSVPARYFISDGEFQESGKKNIKSEDYWSSRCQSILAAIDLSAKTHCPIFLCYNTWKKNQKPTLSCTAYSVFFRGLKTAKVDDCLHTQTTPQFWWDFLLNDKGTLSPSVSKLHTWQACIKFQWQHRKLPPGERNPLSWESVT